jgi:hypothetical protein
VQAPRKSREPLARELMLLYGGEVFGQGMSRKAQSTAEVLVVSPQATPQPASPSGQEQTAKAKAAAKKMPRQCLFLDFAGASQAKGGYLPKASCKRAGGPKRVMAPGAAKMRSHNSWAHYLPTPHQPLDHAPRNEPSSSSSAAASSAQAFAEEARCDPAADPMAAEASPEALAVSTERGGEAPTSTLASEEAVEPAPSVAASPEKKRGPKYCVAPGGSRPKNTSQKVPPSQFMVLEFRTEPRVVPASRAPAKAEGRGSALRFRPKSRDWAAEREVLSMH